jgi:hypothetical protein
MLDLRHRAGLQIAQGDFGFWVQFLEVDRGFARKLLAVAISSGRQTSMPRAGFRIDRDFQAGSRHVGWVVGVTRIAGQARCGRAAVASIEAVAEPRGGSIRMRLADPAGVVADSAFGCQNVPSSYRLIAALAGLRTLIQHFARPET